MLNSKVLLVKLLFKQPCKACLMYICSFNDAFTCSIFRGCLIPILDYLQYDKKCKFFLNFFRISKHKVRKGHCSQKEERGRIGGCPVL